jgi:hypothetical protein
MTNIYAQVLHNILVQYGRRVCDEPQRVRALLRDLLSAHPGRHDSPINVLVLALEHRAVKELLSGGGIPPEMLQRRIAARLQTELGQTEAASRWAVTTWATALELQAPAAPAAAVSAVAAAPRTQGVPAAPITQPAATSASSRSAPAAPPAVPARPAAKPIELDPAWVMSSNPSQATELLPSAAGSWKRPIAQIARRKPILLASVAGAVLLLGIGGVAAALIFSGSRPVPTSEAAPVKEPEKPKSTEPEVDKSWVVMFRSADPSIWNDDVNKGPDHFAKAIDLAPEDMRYLRLTNMATKEFVIVEVTKAGLGQQSGEGRYGWEGRNQFDSEAHHLGIYNRIWPAGNRGEICISWPTCRGWGFGHSAFVNGMQFYSWAGKEIPRTVFEIAVKSQPLTAAESKKLLQVGTPRE